jgi:hypothetical protein
VYACSFSEQPSGNDSRIVEHQEFITSEKVGKTSKFRIGSGPGYAVEQEQPGGGAFGERALGNLLFWEAVIELIGAHSELSVPQVTKSWKRLELGLRNQI